MRRSRLYLIVPVVAVLLVGGVVGPMVPTAKAAPCSATTCTPEPPPTGTPTWNVMFFGYYCTDRTTTCTAQSGRLRYISAEVYGQDGQYTGQANPDGYAFDCGYFSYNRNTDTTTYYHQSVWDKNWGKSGQTPPQPPLWGGVATNAGGDDTGTTPNTSARGWLSGSASDPKTMDTASMPLQSVRQFANNATHMLVSGSSMTINTSGALWRGLPNSHATAADTLVADAGQQKLSCSASNTTLFQATSDNFNGSAMWDQIDSNNLDRMMAESTFEPYDQEPNYPFAL